MKVCFICSEYPPAANGGIGTFIKELGETLVKSGHEVKVIGLYRNEPKTEIINGVEIHRLKKSTKPLTWIYDIRKVYRQVKSWADHNEIDLIEDNDWDSYSAFFGTLGIPIVYRIHNRYLAVIRSTKEFEYSRRLKLQRALKKCNAVVGVSQNILESLESLISFDAPRKVIYNGVVVPDSRVPVEYRTPNKVMFAGTLVEEKGIKKLIQAWKLVIKSIPDANLYVFGKDNISSNGGSMIQELKAMLQGDMESSVHFAGHVTKDELNLHFKNSMLFVSPSFFEAFSLAPLEAMAYGCPTIYTKLTSGPEALLDGVEGTLIDPYNSVEIAEAIVSLLQDSKTAECYSKMGYQRVLNSFDVRDRSIENINFYENLIKS